MITVLITESCKRSDWPLIDHFISQQSYGGKHKKNMGVYLQKGELKVGGRGGILSKQNDTYA